MSEELGPVEYLIVAFPGNNFSGEIAPALGDLVKAGTIRIIDIAFVGKSAEGDIVAAELSDLHPEVQRALQELDPGVSGLFNEEDLMAAGEELEPNSSAALLVWENVWARKVADAIRAAKGEILDYDRVPRDVILAAREWAAAATA